MLCTVLQRVAMIPTPALPGSGVSVISTERHSDAVGDLSAQFFRAPDCDLVFQVQLLPVREQLRTVYLIYSCPSSQQQWGGASKNWGGNSLGIQAAVAGIVCRLLPRRSAAAKPGLTGRSVFLRGQGRHKTCLQEDLMGLAGRGLTKHLRLGTCHQYRHQVGEACCRRGGVAGAEPPHKGGPNRPDRPNARRE